MSVLEQVESSVRQALEPLRTVGIWVRTMPESPREWGQQSTNGELFLLFEKADGKPPEVGTIGGINQDETLTLLIEMRVKKVRSEGGAYPLIEAVKSMVSGLRPLGISQPVYFDSWKWMGEDKGMWVYQMRFGMKTAFIRLTGEDVILPLLKQVEFEDNYGGAITPNPNYE